MRNFLRLLPASFVFLQLGTAQDLNSNGLNDLWEQRFSLYGKNINRNHDSDGDGVSNVKEALAGTNPFDRKSALKLDSKLFGKKKDDPTVSFDTVEGKFYTVEVSDGIVDFRPFSTGWWGDGHRRDVKITEAGGFETARPIRAEFWRTLAGDSMADLTGLASYPDNPDGVMHLPQPASPRFLSGKHGAKLEMWITPPRSGNYRFFLSSEGPSQLFFRSTVEGGALSKVAEIASVDSGVERTKWHTDNGGTTTSVAMEAGKRYYLELRYVSGTGSQHCHIGWSGPGLRGVQRLGRGALAKSFSPPLNQAAGGYFKDYDTDGQTRKAWAADSSLEDMVADMPEMEERVKFEGNQADTPIMRAIFPLQSKTLYGTWLFNMAGGDAGHQFIGLFTGNKNTGNREEGPRINFNGPRDGRQPSVSAGSWNGAERTFSVNADQTYRIEILATIQDNGFVYKTPTGNSRVRKNTFDVYVTTVGGRLVGSAKGLSFRDGNLVTGFGEIATKLVTNPNIAFDSWEFTGGQIAGNGYITENVTLGAGGRKFYRVTVTDQDQDGDGVSDSDEMLLSKYHRVLFFDKQATAGTDDANTSERLVRRSGDKVKFSLVGTDLAAFESNAPFAGVDNGSIRISRSGTLEPVTVDLCIAPMESTGKVSSECDGTCCKLIGSAGAEAAEQNDYVIKDEDGNIVTNRVTFAFGEVSKNLTVEAVLDSEYEYPETLNIAIAEPEDGRYLLSDRNGASIQLFDLPEHPSNIMFFTGRYSQDGRAVTPTTASGYTTATINGPRTKVEIWTEFSGLTSPQNNAHVHKSGPGRTPGMVVYGITEIPGDPGSSPLLGALAGYTWDLTKGTGAISSVGNPTGNQVVVDSLFNQARETPLYFNIHTRNNPEGEVWAFYSASEGRKDDPGSADPGPQPGSSNFPQLTGVDLEREIRRFFNQATFGLREDYITTMLKKIEDKRKIDPEYHRVEAFRDWIEDQIDPKVTPQTYFHDLVFAQHFQALKAESLWDYKYQTNKTKYPKAPVEPNPYPHIDRSDKNPDRWILSSRHPLGVLPEGYIKSVVVGTKKFNIGHWGRQEMTAALWQLKVNGRDQLRHKMGYALAQIVVTSMAEQWLWDNSNGMANYWDQINIRAFSNYRDVLYFANRSPVMGFYLSSTKNQKAIDANNDGVFEVFPDENLARENMQLFSIGLFERWSDGSLVLGADGLPKPTYTIRDIQEFAKVITGLSLGVGGRGAYGGGHLRANTNFAVQHLAMGLTNRTFLFPMRMFGEYHQPGPKTFAGTTIDNSNLRSSTDIRNKVSNSAESDADLDDAIDWLAGRPGDGKADYNMTASHRSTPAFISRILIQRFTTSNPSREYLHRVATVFKDTAGNLGEVIKAILLDPEARNLDLNNTKFGLKKSPAEAYVQLIRSLDGYTGLPLYETDGSSRPYEYFAGKYPGLYDNKNLYLSTFGYPQSQIDAQERNIRIRAQDSGKIGEPSDGLSMDFGYAGSVFNFYQPDYSKHGILRESNLVAPELQLATEPEVVKNNNIFFYLVNGTGRKGQKIGWQNGENIFGAYSKKSDELVRLQLPMNHLVKTLYPEKKPAARPGRSSDSQADQFLVDKLDMLLTSGLLKKQYPYFSGDDDDPNVPGKDDLLKNPREIIIDAITNMHPTSYGESDSENHQARKAKLQDALFLLISSADFQIKK